MTQPSRRPVLLPLSTTPRRSQLKTVLAFSSAVIPSSNYCSCRQQKEEKLRTRYYVLPCFQASVVVDILSSSTSEVGVPSAKDFLLLLLCFFYGTSNMELLKPFSNLREKDSSFLNSNLNKNPQEMQTIEKHISLASKSLSFGV